MKNGEMLEITGSVMIHQCVVLQCGELGLGFLFFCVEYPCDAEEIPRHQRGADRDQNRLSEGTRQVLLSGGQDDTGLAHHHAHPMLQ